MTVVCLYLAGRVLTVVAIVAAWTDVAVGIVVFLGVFLPIYNAYLLVAGIANAVISILPDMSFAVVIVGILDFAVIIISICCVPAISIIRNNIVMLTADSQVQLITRFRLDSIAFTIYVYFDILTVFCSLWNSKPYVIPASFAVQNN